MECKDCCHYDCCNNSVSSSHNSEASGYKKKPTRAPSLKTIREKYQASKNVRHDEDYEALEPLLKKPDKQPITLFFESQIWGCILVSISALSYGLSASLVSIEHDITTPIIIIARFTGAFLLTAITCIFQDVPVLSFLNSSTCADHMLIIVRSFFGVISFACGTYAFQGMPVGEATVIVSMAPLFVSLLSMCFLQEPLRLIPALTTVTSLLGIFLITDPVKLGTSKESKGVTYYTAAGAAVIQALSKAIVYIYLRKTNNRIYFMTVIFWYTLFGVLSVAMMTAILFYSLSYAGKDTSWIISPLQSHDYYILSLISFFGFLSQMTLTRAVQLVNTTLCSLIRNADILVTLVFQIFYFHLLPCWIQIIGIVVMMLSTFGMVFYKERENGRDGERER